MKPLHIVSTVFLVFALLASAGCSSTRTQESTSEYISDSAITAKVKAAILNEPSLKSAEVNVETFKGVVQLSGFLSPESNWNKAVEIALDIKGVKSVRNDMRIK